MKIAVIGSGISGLSVANMLNSSHDVIVFEKSKQVGGIIKCTREEGNLFHRVGGHVFNSKNQLVLDWFWSFFKQDEFVSTTRKAKIFLNNSYLNYPIENNIYKLPKETISNIIKELLLINEEESYDNFESFLRGNFGDTLYDLYFKPYNEKIWNFNLKEIPLDWLQGKLPMPNIQEIILSNILKQEETNMVHSSFYYPKNNGSQFIVDRLAEKILINRNFEITSLKKNENGWYVNETFFDCVIYTGDIRKLGKLISHDSNELSSNLKDATSFVSNGTSNVLCYTDYMDLSWLYFPEKPIIPHRIIYTGNFSESNNSSNHKTCVVEFSGEYSEDKMVEELKKMPGSLTPIAFNYEPNSYVINTFGTRKLVDKIKTELKFDNFYLLGRFAEWQYYNMDKCIEAAFDIVKQIE